ncbi:MAG: ComEC/Rec2 family competence protein [Oscillospiraceae bacterium]
MADRRKSRKRERRGGGKAKFFPLTALLVLIAASVFLFLNEYFLHIDSVPTFGEMLKTVGVLPKKVTAAEGQLAVHYIDVGQGDCQLITVGESNVLIDCGEEEQYGVVREYLDSLRIKRLDLVIATHPHSDHIGGMHLLLSDFEVGRFIMPRTADNMVPNTDCYGLMLDVIEDKEIPAAYAEVGEIIGLDGGAELEILAPLHDDYGNLNNYSVVTRLVFGDTSFLFTGDAERASENDILNSGAYIDSDVIKIAHHGSTSSSTEAFLREVSPRYAVLFVGENNPYGHPNPNVLQRLADVGCECFVTRDCGDIVFVSDGAALEMYFSKEEEESAA